MHTLIYYDKYIYLLHDISTMYWLSICKLIPCYQGMIPSYD